MIYRTLHFLVFLGGLYIMNIASNWMINIMGILICLQALSGVFDKDKTS